MSPNSTLGTFSSMLLRFALLLAISPLVLATKSIGIPAVLAVSCKNEGDEVSVSFLLIDALVHTYGFRLGNECVSCHIAFQDTGTKKVLTIGGNNLCAVDNHKIECAQVPETCRIDMIKVETFRNAYENPLIVKDGVVVGEFKDMVYKSSGEYHSYPHGEIQFIRRKDFDHRNLAKNAFALVLPNKAIFEYRLFAEEIVDDDQRLPESLPVLFETQPLSGDKEKIAHVAILEDKVSLATFAGLRQCTFQSVQGSRNLLLHPYHQHVIEFKDKRVQSSFNHAPACFVWNLSLTKLDMPKSALLTYSGKDFGAIFNNQFHPAISVNRSKLTGGHDLWYDRLRAYVIIRGTVIYIYGMRLEHFDIQNYEVSIHDRVLLLETFSGSIHQTDIYRFDKKSTHETNSIENCKIQFNSTMELQTISVGKKENVSYVFSDVALTNANLVKHCNFKIKALRRSPVHHQITKWRYAKECIATVKNGKQSTHVSLREIQRSGGVLLTPFDTQNKLHEHPWALFSEMEGTFVYGDLSAEDVSDFTVPSAEGRIVFSRCARGSTSNQSYGLVFAGEASKVLNGSGVCSKCTLSATKNGLKVGNAEAFVLENGKLVQKRENIPCACSFESVPLRIQQFHTKGQLIYDEDGIYGRYNGSSVTFTADGVVFSEELGAYFPVRPKLEIWGSGDFVFMKRNDLFYSQYLRQTNLHDKCDLIRIKMTDNTCFLASRLPLPQRCGSKQLQFNELKFDNSTIYRVVHGSSGHATFELVDGMFEVHDFNTKKIISCVPELEFIPNLESGFNRSDKIISIKTQYSTGFLFNDRVYSIDKGLQESKVFTLDGDFLIESGDVLVATLDDYKQSKEFELAVLQETAYKLSSTPVDLIDFSVSLNSENELKFDPEISIDAEEIGGFRVFVHSDYWIRVKDDEMVVSYFSGKDKATVEERKRAEILSMERAKIHVGVISKCKDEIEKNGKCQVPVASSQEQDKFETRQVILVVLGGSITVFSTVCISVFMRRK